MTRELLIKFRGKMLDFYSNYNYGLCIALYRVYCFEHFTREEYDLLTEFLENNKPVRRYKKNNSFWFHPTNLKSRLSWIDKQIKAL